MEEIPEEFLDQLLTEPEKKARKAKVIERDHRSWFYVAVTQIAECDNEECIDPRKKKHVMVWTHPEGKRMCRYCFLAGWLADA